MDFSQIEFASAWRRSRYADDLQSHVLEQYQAKGASEEKLASKQEASRHVQGNIEKTALLERVFALCCYEAALEKKRAVGSGFWAKQREHYRDQLVAAYLDHVFLMAAVAGDQPGSPGYNPEVAEDARKEKEELDNAVKRLESQAVTQARGFLTARASERPGLPRL